MRVVQSRTVIFFSRCQLLQQYNQDKGYTGGCGITVTLTLTAIVTLFLASALALVVAESTLPKVIIYKSREAYFFICFVHENIKKLPPKVAYFSLISEIFSTANQLKTSPNFKLFFIKMAHRATYIYNVFDSTTKGHKEVVLHAGA